MSGAKPYKDPNYIKGYSKGYAAMRTRCKWLAAELKESRRLLNELENIFNDVCEENKALQSRAKRFGIN